MRRSLGVLAVAAVAVPVLAAPVSAAESGSRTFTSGSGSLKVRWSYGCGTATADTDTWRPWVDVHVAETGDTRWRQVRVVYLVRRTDETVTAARYTGGIGPPGSVFDPPLWRSSRLVWDPYGGMLDFAPAVGFRVAVTRDGSTWTTLTSSMLDCTDPTP